MPDVDTRDGWFLGSKVQPKKDKELVQGVGFCGGAAHSDVDEQVYVATDPHEFAHMHVGMVEQTQVNRGECVLGAERIRGTCNRPPISRQWCHCWAGSAHLASPVGTRITASLGV